MRIQPLKPTQNKLASEKSPYLLQHAENPVNWYPWGSEAFDKAEKEGKPIFLSIGYSTCHWCHVMAHESFEDEEVAKLMNEFFIAVKVDREERPDIDEVYMKVCQLMTGSGGWPLTIIMTPDKRPFFAATYIPKSTNFGRSGMMDLVPRIGNLWDKKKDDLLGSANQVVSALEDVSEYSPGEELDRTILTAAYDQLVASFDESHGGFRTAPKFPTPHNLLFLLRYWRRTGDDKALKMVEKTLRSMRSGGVYDHIGFGFHRYSTDSRWFLPHFEKMLYDQAMLAMAYTEAYQATKEDEYKKTAQEIFAYVMRDMTSPEGGFYSAEDADSEGEEGKFYVWSEKELREVLTEDEADLVQRVFGTQPDGNYREEATGRKTGQNILHLEQPVEYHAAADGISSRDITERLEIIRQKLIAHREKRIHPLKDDKILTDWNGLMIAAFAKGAQVFNDDGYAGTAKGAADFILKNAKTSENRLLHRFRDGEAGIQAHLDDYSFLIWGLLELYEASFEIDYLKHAIELNADLIEHFWDSDNGGFYSTADDAEELLIRQKEIYDGAIPSGNSVAVLNLLRLGRFTSNPDHEDKASKIAHIFSSSVGSQPSAFTQFLAGMDFAFGPSHEIVIVGDSESDETKAMIRALRETYTPSKVVIRKPTERPSEDLENIAQFTSDQSMVDGKTTAYVCMNYSCRSPTTDVGEMLDLLKSAE
jgi:uncharacterized protein YyaL (SSP411 family)